MLVEFAVQNFRSFKDLQVFSMEATKEKDDANPRFDQIYENGKVRLLKAKAIYGANASGKSNLIVALNAFWAILQSNLINDKTLGAQFRPNKILNAHDPKSPTYFQIIWFQDEIHYRYGFEFDSKRICSEWLYKKRKKEVLLFERNDNRALEINSSSFNEGKLLQKNQVKIFKDTTLVLSVLSALNSNISSQLVEAILNRLITDLSENMKFDNTQTIQNVYLRDKGYKAWLDLYIKSVDPTVLGIQLKKNQNGDSHFVLLREQRDKTVTFNLKFEEAEGTKKIINISIFLFVATYSPITFVIDELDAKLHPKLSRQIIEFFQSERVHPQSQLIFVSHDTNLLDAGLLRRDQITFVEKSKEGYSEIFDLSDIKGVRAKDLFEKNYLKGNYGAIPTLLNFGENLAANG